MTYIELKPVGVVEDEVLAVISAAIVERYPVEVRVSDPLPDPVAAYDPRRQQYSSVVMLKTLVGSGRPDALRVIGITGRDLFIPMLSFVFGQAQLNGRIALVSIARLNQEFYGLPPNRAVLLDRAVKETMHELGHTFGLVHCPDGNCPMSLSTTVRQVDTKGPDYCAACGSHLNRAVGQARRPPFGSVAHSRGGNE